MYMLSAYFMWMEYFSDAGPSVVPLSAPHNESKLVPPRHFLIWTHLLESSSEPAPQFSWKKLFNSQHLFYLNTIIKIRAPLKLGLCRAHTPRAYCTICNYLLNGALQKISLWKKITSENVFFYATCVVLLGL